MVTASEGSVYAAPAHQLRAPGHVRVLAVHKKVGVEKLAVERDILDHLTAIESRGRGGSEHKLVLQVMSVVDFLTAAVEVTQHRIEVNTGGVHQGPRGDVEGRGHGQQLSAHRADLGIDMTRIHQRLDDIGKQQHIRVESEHPIAARYPDRLILRRGESDVFAVVDYSAAIFKLLKYVYRAILRIVIDDDDLPVWIPLSQYGFQAPLYESTTVVGNYRDGHEVVLGHEK